MAKQIKAKVIIEVVGAPKEHVETTLKNIVNKVKDEKDLNLLRSEFFEAKETEVKDMPQKVWSAFFELDITVPNINRLISFCFDYMPSSIDILDPSKLDLNAGEISDMLNDLLAGLHKYDLILKNIHAQNILLKRELDKNKEEKK